MPLATSSSTADNARPSVQQLLNCQSRLAPFEKCAMRRIIHYIHIVGDVIVQPEFRTKSTFN